MEPLEAGIMNSRRFATVAAVLCQTVILAAWVVAWVVGFGPAGIENTDAAPIADRRQISPSADSDVADAARTTTVTNAAVDNAAVATAIQSVTGPERAESILEAVLPDSSQTLAPETSPVEAATKGPDPLEKDGKNTVGVLEIREECLAVDVCIDRFLFALYQRTPKEDSIRVPEQRKVTVRKRGKKVTVTRTFTRLVDEDFAWKDPKAAERAGKPMIDYVIGGMDRSFRLKLFHALHAAEEAGFSPGITSGFRDDYRQSIASGLKAAADRSYHGGSFRGGYGHGLAADIVSVKGRTRVERWASTESLWKWIDAHGKEFGIGRPYLDRDPPHVAPIDGREYAAHHHGGKSREARAELKKRHRLAARNDRRVATHSKTARSSKVRTI
jgi:hypothetical protein